MPETIEAFKEDERMEETPQLTQELSRIAESHLQLDLHDGSHEISQYIGFLLDTIELLQARARFAVARSGSNARESESKIEAQQPQGSKAPNEEVSEEKGTEEEPPRFQFLHEVVCHGDRISPHHHDYFDFEDEPVYKMNRYGTSVMTGDRPVINMKDHLNERPNIAFIVMKEHDCSPRSPETNSENTHTIILGRREKLWVISPVLNSALQRVATFNPYVGPPSLNATALFFGEILAPYVFFYHHRQQLRELCDHEATYKPVLQPLLEFLGRYYSDEYQSAQDMFQRGYVTAYHASKLYVPQEVYIRNSRDEKQQKGFVLEGLPMSSEKKGKALVLRLWSWTYNGRYLQREYCEEDINPFPLEETPITSLEVYPSRYADRDVIDSMRQAGHAFWRMRNQGLWCYTGWDANHSRFYVCPRLSSQSHAYSRHIV